MMPGILNGVKLGVLALILTACSSSLGSPETSVAVGTFNIAWLGDGQDDKQPRTDADYLRIADIIIKSRSDVLAVQEIENESALRRVLRYMDGYDGFVAALSGPQNVGVIYRKDVRVDSVQTYRPLQLDVPDELRPGLVVRCQKGAFQWVQMIVHLKSTSRYDSTIALTELSRDFRARQVRVLRAWSDSMIASGTKNVLITGDLNDYPQRTKNATLTPLIDNSDLKFLTASLSSCKDHKWHLIDHIVASQGASARFVDGSARTENQFDFLTEEEARGVSDHCPVVVRFSILDQVN